MRPAGEPARAGLTVALRPDGITISTPPTITIRPDGIEITGYPAGDLDAVMQAIDGHPLVCMNQLESGHEVHSHTFNVSTERKSR